MNKTQRGCLVFIGMMVFVGAFCLWIPFILLPGAGIGVAMPVIYVPGEVLIPNWLGDGFSLTNTLVGTILADLLVLLIVLLVVLRGGIKQIPGRLQSVLELLVGFMYNFAKQVAGSRAGRIFPLVMSIFFFLLIANWLELVPGVDSVGMLHCAAPGFNGYPVSVNGAPLAPDGSQPIEGVATLRNTNPLNGGTKATMANFCACEAIHLGHVPAEDGSECVVALAEAGVDVPRSELVMAVRDLDLPETSALVQELQAEGALDAEAAGEAQEHAGGEHFEFSPALMAAIGAANDRYQDMQAATADGDADRAAELAAGAVDANLFVVTPFVRAAATDLNLTLGLAIIAVVMIQVFGVWSLGPDYFQKFFNMRALGNLNKKPLGAIDFVVGLFEIISEFIKILSFGFRLFGNIFAGQVLLFIMAFLVATMLPVVFYALELFVGLMQAFVFAVLTLIFSAQAMESHGADDHH